MSKFNNKEARTTSVTDPTYCSDVSIIEFQQVIEYGFDLLCGLVGFLCFGGE